jgi:hypothetical protein
MPPTAMGLKIHPDDPTPRSKKLDVVPEHLNRPEAATVQKDERRARFEVLVARS